MPLLAAKSCYPLSVRALQRSGGIESDEAFTARRQRETAEELRQYLKDSERTWQDAISQMPADSPKRA